VGGAARSARRPRRQPARRRGADHDLEHLTYTDPDKSIADFGTWEEHDRNDRRLVFTLHGQRDSRRYALIRTESDYLLHLMRDQAAR
jgi:hypothetical protein